MSETRPQTKARMIAGFMLMLLALAIVMPSVMIYLELREAADAPDEPELNALAEGFMEISHRIYPLFHSGPPSRPANFAGFLNYAFAALALTALALSALGARTLMTGPKA